MHRVPICIMWYRCLTDTLVQVPSEQDYELLERGRTVRQEVFEVVRQHLRELTFPEASGDPFLELIKVSQHAPAWLQLHFLPPGKSAMTHASLLRSSIVNPALTACRMPVAVASSIEVCGGLSSVVQKLRGFCTAALMRPAACTV